MVEPKFKNNHTDIIKEYTEENTFYRSVQMWFVQLYARTGPGSVRSLMIPEPETGLLLL